MAESEGLIGLLGRAHVLLVHFPYALLPLAVAFEFIGRRRTWDERHGTGRILLTVAAASAVLAVVSGWENAGEDALAATPLTQQLHRWSGVVVALVACVGVGLGFTSRETTDRAPKGYRPVLATAALLVLVTGHLGTTLVYGSGYLVGEPSVELTSEASAPLSAVEVEHMRKLMETAPPSNGDEAG